MLPSIVKRAPNSIRRGAKFQERGELSLRARATVIDEQVSRRSLRYSDAEVLLDEREREVNSGGYTAGGVDVSVLHVNLVAVHPDFGERAPQLSGRLPVSGRLAAIQQTCFGN